MFAYCSLIWSALPSYRFNSSNCARYSPLSSSLAVYWGCANVKSAIVEFAPMAPDLSAAFSAALSLAIFARNYFVSSFKAFDCALWRSNSWFSTSTSYWCCSFYSCSARVIYRSCVAKMSTTCMTCSERNWSIASAISRAICSRTCCRSATDSVVDTGIGAGAGCSYAGTPKTPVAGTIGPPHEEFPSNAPTVTIPPYAPDDAIPSYPLGPTPEL